MFILDGAAGEGTVAMLHSVDRSRSEIVTVHYPVAVRFLLVAAGGHTC